MIRDGSTVRAFLLPTFEYVTVSITGIKVLYFVNTLIKLHKLKIFSRFK